MEIEFHDRKLRQLSENLALQNRSLGADCAKKLRTRLSDLEAAANVQELTAGHPHPLTGTRASQFSLNLTGGVRLVFVANHEPAPLTVDGSIDWALVTRVRIVFIGDYHD